MTRSSVLLVALLSTLALAQNDGQYTPSAPENPYSTSTSNLEHFPSIINDLTSEAPYPTGGSSVVPPPVYGTPSAPPPEVTPPVYPTGTEAPVPTETGGPIYGGPTGTASPPPPPPPPPTYAPPATIATTYVPVVGGNATATGVESGVPAPVEPTATGEALSAGNAVAVKLPVVLGAIGLAFAML